MDEDVLAVIRAGLPVDRLASIDAYVLVAAVTYLDDDETVILNLPPENQRSWQTLGLLEVATIYERQINVNAWEGS